MCSATKQGGGGVVWRLVSELLFFDFQSVRRPTCLPPLPTRSPECWVCLSDSVVPTAGPLPRILALLAGEVI